MKNTIDDATHNEWVEADKANHCFKDNGNFAYRVKPTHMSHEQTVAFLVAHEDETFALAKRLAYAVMPDNGPERNALRMMPLLIRLPEIREAAMRLVKQNGGPITGDDNREYVMVRSDNFDALCKLLFP